MPDNDGILENPGDNEMPDTGADLSDTCLGLLLDQQFAASDAMNLESEANANSAHSIVRHSSARKFNQEDPIEAAAAEMILQKNV